MWWDDVKYIFTRLRKKEGMCICVCVIISLAFYYWIYFFGVNKSVLFVRVTLGTSNFKKTKGRWVFLNISSLVCIKLWQWLFSSKVNIKRITYLNNFFFDLNWKTCIFSVYVVYIEFQPLICCLFVHYSTIFFSK